METIDVLTMKLMSRVVSVSELERFCNCALRGAGVSSDHARATTEALVTADTWGVLTHGTKLLGGLRHRVCTSSEDRLQGLLVLALICDGQADTIAEASQLVTKENDR